MSQSDFLNFKQAGLFNGGDDVINRQPPAPRNFGLPDFSRPAAGNVRFIPGALLGGGQRAGEGVLPQASLAQFSAPRLPAEAR